jgi:hypothetical protein
MQLQSIFNKPACGPGMAQRPEVGEGFWKKPTIGPGCRSLAMRDWRLTLARSLAMMASSESHPVPP